jgi:flagellar biosynthetic protein FliS
MMPSNPYAAYLQANVLTAEPVELVRILHRSALESLRDARAHLVGGDIAGRSAAISKTMNIVRELSLSVNHESDPALARRLVELYDYIQRRLLAGHLEQSEKPLLEVTGLLTTLCEAWEKVEIHPQEENFDVSAEMINAEL